MSPKSICIVTPDIIGPIKNGGIGTHCYFLAKLLAADPAQRVTVLFTSDHTDSPIEPCKRTYAELGIEFVWIGELPATGAPVVCSGAGAETSARIHEFLRGRDFDFVHFQDWQANGFVPIQAKRAGLAYADTLLTVTMHSSTQWQTQGMQAWSVHPDTDALLAWCERFACEHADLLIAPTQHMFDWALANRWSLSDSRRLVRYCYQADPAHTQPLGAPDPGHLVFFGRLETRKGLGIFCRGLVAALEQRPGCVRRVTFLGKVAGIEGMRADRFIRETLPASGGPTWEIVDDLDSFQAIERIRESRGVVVIPSLLDNSPFTVIECIEYGIPFLAARTGGIPELTDPRVLFDATAASLAESLLGLGDTLAATLEHPYSTTVAERGWAEVHALAPPASPAVSVDGARPRVSVCVAHHDHGPFLPQTLQSLAAQDYPNLDVIVIDDGSTDPDSKRVFAEMGKTYPDWTFVEQENQGPERTRNAAARRARGELLLFQDSDNVAGPAMVRTLVETLERSAADCVTCWFRAFSGAGPPDERTSVAFHGRPVGPCLDYGALENVLGDTNFLVKADVFESLGGFADGGHGTEDWEFLLHLALSGHSLVVAPQALFWYRVAEGSISQRRSDYLSRRRVLRAYFQRDPLLGQVLAELTVPTWERMRYLERRVKKLDFLQSLLPKFLVQGRGGRALEGTFGALQRLARKDADAEDDSK